MHVAYKHLNAKLKIGELTVGQWAVAFGGVMLMLAWGFYLSPLSPDLTIITAVYLGGLPVAMALLATYAEFNVWRFARSAWRWTLSPGRYAPGPGGPSRGYVITSDPSAPRAGLAQRRHPDLETLWD